MDSLCGLLGGTSDQDAQTKEPTKWDSQVQRSFSVGSGFINTWTALPSGKKVTGRPAISRWWCSRRAEVLAIESRACGGFYFELAGLKRCPLQMRLQVADTF